MNKIVCLVLCVMLLMTLVGCANKKTETVQVMSNNNEITSVDKTSETMQDTAVSKGSYVDSFDADNFNSKTSDGTLKIYKANEPYVSIRCDLLDMTAMEYQTKTGAQFLKIKNPEEQYYLRLSDTAQYFYGTDEVLVGIRNGAVCLVASYDSLRVRDFINSTGSIEFWKSSPNANVVANWHNSKNFYYWKIDNGYIGFITLAKDNIFNFYNSEIFSTIYFKEPNDINIIKSVFDCEIKVEVAMDKHYGNQGNYEVFEFDDSEYGVNLIFAPDSKISNFKFFKYYSKELYDDSDSINAEILFECDELTSDKPFATKISFMSYDVNFGISYIDIYGNQKNFTVYESAADGSIYLEPF